MSPAAPSASAPSAPAAPAAPAAVTPTPNETRAYIQAWGIQRCGKQLPAVEKAWGILASTVFRAGQGAALGHSYCGNYRPAHGWDATLARESSFWRGGFKLDKDAADYAAGLFQAWTLLTDSAEECGTDAIKFDIADVGREWMQTVPCVANMRALASSWRNKSVTQAKGAAATLSGTLADIDMLLSSVDGFLFGAWVGAAQNLSDTAEGQAQLVMNAKAQVTTWATFPPGQPWSHAVVPQGTFPGIDGYATKQWGGLIRQSAA